MRSSPTALRPIVPVLAALSFTNPLLDAATRDWSGASGGGLWSSAGNWNTGVPANGDTVVFGTAGGGDSFGNLSLTLPEIRYAPAVLPAHNIHFTNGTSLTLTGFGINNISRFTNGSGVIRQQIYLDAGSTMTLQNAATIGGNEPVFNLPVDVNAQGGTTGGGAGGRLIFENNSTASGPPALTFTGLRALGGKVAGAQGGELRFRDDAKMGFTASFAAYGGDVAGALGAVVTFENRAEGSGNVSNVTGSGLGPKIVAQDTAVLGGSLNLGNYGAIHATAGAEAVTQFFDSTVLAGFAQNFPGYVADAAGGRVEFRENSRVGGVDGAQIFNRGSMILFGIPGPAGLGGSAVFYDDSFVTGANVTITNSSEGEDTNPGGMGGTTEFRNRSRAGAATIINSGASSSAAGSLGGRTFFREESTAETASITVNGGIRETGAPGGYVEFSGTATAANSTLTALGGFNGGSGGKILFTGNANGAVAKAIVETGGELDISALAGVGTTLGSIEGAGSFLLGGKSLTTGGNGLSAIVSGVIADGGQADGTGASLTKVGVGTLELGGANTHTGPTAVSAGMLLVTGSLLNGAVSVASGATLGGTGTIGGAVGIANGGTVSPGKSGAGTLTTGPLALGASSVLTWQIGSVSDRMDVNGNLTLDGTLNLSALPGLTAGIYRLFNYTGTLTNNVLALGSVPAGTTAAQFSIQTDVPGQVNLVLNGGAGELLFWDGSNTTANGAVNGGNGSWTSSATNWTNSAGTVNQAWASQKAVFSGAAGTVTLGENVTTTGLQFATSGYVINPGAGSTITLNGGVVARTEGTPGATINASLGGSGSLTKTGNGTLALAGASGYSGGTTMVEGLLDVSNAAGLGLGSGPVTVRPLANAYLRFLANGSAGNLVISNEVGVADYPGTIHATGTATMAGAAVANAGNIADGGFGARISFSGSARGGSATIHNLGAGFAAPSSPGSLAEGGGLANFGFTSSAETASITNDAGLGSGLNGGRTTFNGSSSAAGATVLNRGGTIPGAVGGGTAFYGNADGGTSTLTVEGGSNGGTGGTIRFTENATGGLSRVIFQPGGAPDGLLALSGSSFARVAVGSIEGNGLISLGGKGIETGGRNVDTEFSGSIDGFGGTLRKVGTAMLTLSGNSYYTGGTVLSDGVLRVSNPSGLGLGSGPVTVQLSTTSELRFSFTGSAGSLAITNLSGANNVVGLTTFRSSATAATATITNNASTANGLIGGQTRFFATSTAANATINNYGTSYVAGDVGAEVDFRETSTAGAATIINGGGYAASAEGGQANFMDNSSAGTANLTNYFANVPNAFAGATLFRNNANAGNATITNLRSPVSGATGGVTEFFESSTGGTAKITLQGSSTNGAQSSLTRFYHTSSADRAEIDVHGSQSGTGAAGLLEFYQSATAGDSTITNRRSTGGGNGGGLTQFRNSSVAGTASFTNEGPQGNVTGYGSTEFRDSADAQSAEFKNGAGLNPSEFGGRTQFFNSSSAGSAIFDNEGSRVASGYAGEVWFHEISTAGASSITNRGSTVAATTQGAIAYFYGSARAGTAAIVNQGSAFAPNGGVTSGGFTQFANSTSAEQATITNHGAVGAGGSSGVTFFLATSTAGNATLYLNAGTGGGAGGRVLFFDTAEAGTSRAILAGTGGASGLLDISLLTDSGLAIGSIEGNGLVNLGSKNMRAGGNHLSTLFSGMIFNSGSLTKDGTGTLELSGTNTYTGLTTVQAGVLRVSGSLAGAVSVQGGTLGGNGAISGGVTVGPGGVVAPGASIGILTTTGALSLGNGSVYGLEVDSSTNTADRINAVGVSIGVGVNLYGEEIGGGVAPPGQIFKIIDNTSGSPVTGTFAGLAEAAQFTVGNNLFRISYAGGDGNDVTLTQTGTDPYWQWATATSGLSVNDAVATADPDGDGLENFIEFVIGGQPNPLNPNANSSALAPSTSITATHITFIYRRTDLAFARPGIVIQAEYGSGLSGWTAAQHGVAGVSIVTTNDGFGPGVDKVEVSIPRPALPVSNLFVRLGASLP